MAVSVTSFSPPESDWRNNGQEPHIVYQTTKDLFKVLFNNYTSTNSMTSFNSAVRMSDYETNADWLFNRFIGFNSEVIIGNNVNNCTGMFNGCTNFNHAITIPGSVHQTINMFYGCKNFNAPVTFKHVNDSKVASYHNMFTNCINFSQPISFSGENISVGSFVNDVLTNNSYEYKFNAPVSINGNNVKVTNMIAFSRYFNSPITVTANHFNISSVISNCNIFNSPITINASIIEGVFSYYSLVSDCANFNSPVHITGNVTNAVSFIYNCQKFNQPFNCVFNGRVDRMLYLCREFNQPLNLGAITSGVYAFIQTNLNSRVIINDVQDANCYQMFALLNNFSNNIYIMNGVPSNVYQFLQPGTTSNSHRKNLYVPQEAMSLFTQTNTKSIVGNTITWSSSTNCKYNTVYNIYIYNNLPTW